MIKIVYIISDIKNRSVLFERTALILRDNGYKISFILINSKGGVFDFFLQQKDFEISYLQAGRIFFSWGIIIKCYILLKRINPAIVHCHLGTANWIGLWGSYLYGIKKRIYTRHSGFPLHSSFKVRIIDKIQNYLASHIVAISENTRDILLNQNALASKINLIHHGLDIERMMHPNVDEVIKIRQLYNPSAKAPVIGVVARCLELKGIQYIIPAFEKLLIDYPNAKLCLFNIWNNSDYSETIQNLLLKIPKENYVCVKYENNIYDLYQLFDIYVHVPINSTCEAFGQTFIEALAAGIPSVFTLSGVAREFIKDKVNALVVEFKSSNDIYLAIKTFLNDDNLRKKIILQGQMDVKNLFAFDHYISALNRLYT